MKQVAYDSSSLDISKADGNSLEIRKTRENKMLEVLRIYYGWLFNSFCIIKELEPSSFVHLYFMNICQALEMQ